MLKDDKETFFDPSQPLTSTIFKSLNFEFMCCILSGLKEICDKEDRKLKKKSTDKLVKKRTLITIVKKDDKGENEKNEITE